MSFKINTKKPHWLALILLISFPSVATVLISPALPEISHFFNISVGYAQQLIVIFLVGYMLGQLIYSPFANRYGRKVAAYLGVSIYLLGSLACLVGIYFHSINTIFYGRFIMALGSSVGMVITFTIINDFYYPKQTRSVVSYAVLAYAFMPALAIALGGFIATHLSWVDCFYFYLAYGLIMLVTVSRLPETLLEKDLYALKLKPLLASYFQAFKSKRLILFSTIYGLMVAFIYIIASGAPFIGIKAIGLTPSRYGLLLLIPYSGQFIGSISSGRFGNRLTAYEGFKIGFFSVVFGSLLMFFCFLFHWLTVFTLMLPIFFIMLGLPITYSSVIMMGLFGYEDKATGSAVMSAITMFVAFLASFALTVLPGHNPIVMPALFVGLITLVTLAFLYAKSQFQDQ